MDARLLTAELKREAARLGFTLCRVTPAGPTAHADFYDRWIDAGRAGDMTYLATTRELRREPARVVGRGRAPVRSIVVVAMRYRSATLPQAVRSDPSRGLIASYAWEDDYHETMRPRLHALDAFLRARSGRSELAKALVDSGPVLERDWAQRAGIGFTGKNTCTIHPEHGSWFFLGTLLVPEDLAYDPAPYTAEFEPAPALVLRGLPADGSYGAWQVDGESGASTGTCGHCSRCLERCPTGAFVGPFHLDPQRCISYWTIETRRPIPRDLRPRFGNRIFGCDICQEVCPWNTRLEDEQRSSQPLAVAEAAEAGANDRERMAPPLLQGFAADNPYWLEADAFRQHFARSAVLRAARAGMLRNVCVALGNWGDPLAIPALARALDGNDEVARGHAAWALGRVGARHGFDLVRGLLQARQTCEIADSAREEIALALS